MLSHVRWLTEVKLEGAETHVVLQFFTTTASLGISYGEIF